MGGAAGFYFVRDLIRWGAKSKESPQFRWMRNGAADGKPLAIRPGRRRRRFVVGKKSEDYQSADISPREDGEGRCVAGRCWSGDCYREEMRNH